MSLASARVPASTQSWVSATDAVLLILHVNVSKGSSAAQLRLLGTSMPWATHACVPVFPQALGSPSPP